jgi:hypothetical protein
MNEAREFMTKVLEAGNKLLGKRDLGDTSRGNSKVSQDKAKRQKTSDSDSKE